MKITTLLLVFLAVVLVVASVSCNRFTGNAVEYTGSNIGSHIDGSYKLFDGTQSKTIPVKVKQVMEFSYNSTVEEGKLSMTLEDTEKVKVLEFPINTSGVVYINADNTGNYHLIIVGDKTRGRFSVSWKIK